MAFNYNRIMTPIKISTSSNDDRTLVHNFSLKIFKSFQTPRNHMNTAGASKNKTTDTIFNEKKNSKIFSCEVLIGDQFN